MVYLVGRFCSRDSGDTNDEIKPKPLIQAAFDDSGSSTRSVCRTVTLELQPRFVPAKISWQVSPRFGECSSHELRFLRALSLRTCFSIPLPDAQLMGQYSSDHTPYCSFAV